MLEMLKISTDLQGLLRRSCAAHGHAASSKASCAIRLGNGSAVTHDIIPECLGMVVMTVLQCHTQEEGVHTPKKASEEIIEEEGPVCCFVCMNNNST